MSNYRRVAEIDREGHGPDERTTGTIPFAVGVLAWSDFQDVLAYARSRGVEVEVHRVGGWWVRRGYVSMRGTWGQVRPALLMWERVSDRSAA